MRLAKVGWIKLHRQIMDSDFYKEPRKFSKYEAWIDILLRVDHEKNPGTVLINISELAKAWNWDRRKVKRFLSQLENENMCNLNGTADGTLDGTPNGTALTIVNWAFYQGGGTRNGTGNGTADGTQKRVPSYNRKEEKNIYSEIFSHWNQQKITVHRDLTEDMKKAIDATLKAYSQEEVMQAISRYSKIYHDKDYYFKYTWTLISFLKQKNALPDFMEEGQKWIAYKKATTKPEPPKPKPDFDPYEIKHSWKE